MSEEQLAELGRFLKDRRARINPEDVGVPMTTRRRVRGLRREEIASLVGIGVSWYTALENGDAQGVSDRTLLAIADVLRLSISERQYVLALAGRSSELMRETVVIEPIVVDVMNANVYPAYIITASWDIHYCNEAFRRVWNVAEHEVPFNAIERLFLSPVARKMHGEHYAENILPVIGMLRSTHGRQLHPAWMQQICDRLMADELTAKMWNDYEIRSPLLPSKCTVESAIGTITYETLTLPIPGALHAVVVQVPDIESRELLAHGLK